MKSRLFFSIAAVLLCMSMVLGGCRGSSGANPSSDEGAGTTTTSAVTPGSLSEQQISELKLFLNDRANNGLVGPLNLYTRPQESDLFFALYDGAGIGRGLADLSSEEKQAVQSSKSYGAEMPCLAFKTADIETYLQKKLGISMADLSKGTEGMTYVEEYDLYFLQHTDTNLVSIDVLEAELDASGNYIVKYSVPSITDTYVVTLSKAADGYRFVLNSKQ